MWNFSERRRRGPCFGVCAHFDGGGKQGLYTLSESLGQWKLLSVLFVAHALVHHTVAKEVEWRHVLANPRHVQLTAHGQKYSLVIVAPRYGRQRFTLKQKATGTCHCVPRYGRQWFTLKQNATGACHCGPTLWPSAVYP